MNELEKKRRTCWLVFVDSQLGSVGMEVVVVVKGMIRHDRIGSG